MGLFDAFTGSPGKDAAAKNAALYQQYGVDANAALDKDLGLSTGATNSAIGAYAPLSALGTSYGAAPTMLLNSLGVNGQAGNDAARAAFQASPGYQWNVDQNVDQVARYQAAHGGLATGNTLTGIQDRANNLANQQYGQWQTNLGSFTNPALTATGGAASGQAAGYNNLSNLYQTDATNRTGVLGNVTSGQASANTAAAKAAMDANSNFWNSAIKVAGIAAAPFTGGTSLAMLGMPSGTGYNASGGLGFPGGSLTG